MAAHQSTQQSLSMVTSSAASVIFRQPRLLEVGHRADLVATPALNVRQAISMAPSGRIVFKDGKVLSTKTYEALLTNN
jgi:cytosine/adenosine deaminase-related metal-dependent hydrolase